MNVLGIETSCDETSVAIVNDLGQVAVNLVSSQIAQHQPYGGVVPEIASRAHLETLDGLVATAFVQSNLSPADISLIAATRGPGLASSLLIGLSYAKALSVTLDKPFIGINHLHGHLLSPLLSGQIDRGNLFPNVSLVVSGGHTILLHAQSAGSYRKIGATLDDAAGEAFDKAAKLLGLEYPGGPLIDQFAHGGRPDAYDFPRGLGRNANFDFSFSGLKTAIRYFLAKQPEGFAREHRADLCASIQEAICSVLVDKTIRAALMTGVKAVTVSGGVSCNSRLRTLFAEKCSRAGLELHLCPSHFSTDNAAMIALVAAWESTRGNVTDGLADDIEPHLGF